MQKPLLFQVLATFALTLCASAAVAGVAVPPPVTPTVAPVPALSEWSLLALVPLVGAIAYRSTRRKGKGRKDNDGRDQ
mgnify:FL=1